MSIIQLIQEKYAKLMAVIIAIALIIFVVMLAFENGGSLFNRGAGSSIGSVNGHDIDAIAFQKKMEANEEMIKQQGGGQGEGVREKALDQTWNQEVSKLVLGDAFSNLGLSIGKKEMGDILYGVNPPDDIRRQYTDQATGAFNAQQAKMDIDQALKKGTEEQKASLNSYLEQLEFSRLTEKYGTLLANSSNAPKWFVEKQLADESKMAKISIVKANYTSIPDSTIKISDSEIQDYITKHKSLFKQEESRSITYVPFNAAPTAGDSAQAQKLIMNYKAGMDSSKDIKAYLESQGQPNYYGGYIGADKYKKDAKDTLFSTAAGVVAGPYVENGNYVLAKMVAKRTQPDTVKARHILVATTKVDPQTRQTVRVRDTAEALKRMDTVLMALRGGLSFDSAVIRYSDDEASKAKGGVYENMTAGSFVPEFNDFAFGHPVGATGTVKTDFGYHFIQVLETKGSSPAYKIAFYAQPIDASKETDAVASNAATTFAGNSRDRKSFDANAEKLKSQNIQKGNAADILPTASTIMGLGASRAFVRNIYEAKLGDILEPERVGDNYVVAMVTEINEKGTQTVAKARPYVEALLRNKKKAEQIKKNLGTITTLEAASAKLGNAQIDVIDSVRITGTQSQLISAEMRVIGAAFNPANAGKVVPEAIEGNSGVFVERVDNVSTTNVLNSNVEEKRNMLYQQAKMRAGYMGPQVLIQNADIKDKRLKFF